MPSGKGSDARAREAWLSARLTEILTPTPALSGASIGVSVVDTATGRVLFGSKDKQPLNAASNVKLVTTAAALALLGPDFRFRTGVYAAPLTRLGDTIEGDLTIRGVGDPSLGTAELAALAADLASLGIKKFTGGLVLDDSYFDPARTPPAFEQKNEDAYYRAPAGALSLNFNAVAIVVTPGSLDGAPARVAVDPPSAYFEVKPSVTTTATGRSSLRITLKTKPGKQPVLQVFVSGAMRISDEQVVIRKRIDHPDIYLAQTFITELGRRGITLGKKPPRHGVLDPKARALAATYSAPLALLVRDVNKHSNNFMAEQLVKTIGAEATGLPGSWESGIQTIKQYLKDVGIPDGYTLTNGSGLYDSNRLTADMLTRLLRVVHRDFRFSADYLASLPIAGIDGTLSRRLEGTGAERHLRAKTGTLAGVTALSGYVGATGRPALAFAILANGFAQKSASRAAVRAVQDQIAGALVDYLEATPER